MVLKENNHRQKKAWKNKKFSASIKHALQGLKTIVTEERNMRKHISFGIFPILLGWFFKVSPIEWIIIITCIFLVIIMEFLNTIFETVVDMVTDYTFHPLAKKAKDIAAGAVLVTGIFTLIVAAIIFLPKFISLFI